MNNKITAALLLIIAANLTWSNFKQQMAAAKPQQKTELVQVLGRYQAEGPHHTRSFRYIVKGENGLHFANVPYKMSDNVEYMLETSWGQEIPMSKASEENPF